MSENCDIMGAWTASLRGQLTVNRKEGTLLVWVPPGEFEMGDGKGGDCPKHKVWMDGYWMGVYCVTNRQYGKFVVETKRVVKGGGWKLEAGKENHPAVNVSWADCAAYAKWAGLSLPTEAQWEKACRGPKGTIYPWGNKWYAKRDLYNMTQGRNPLVGAYAVGVSGYGTYRQSGNVWEWCSDWYGDDYYKAVGSGKNPAGPAKGSLRVNRGGCSRNDAASYFRGAFRNFDVPAYRNDILGFRLVRMVS
jgi:sulfatase modifying factor 1